jgi:hypothetical protein
LENAAKEVNVRESMNKATKGRGITSHTLREYLSLKRAIEPKVDLKTNNVNFQQPNVHLAKIGFPLRDKAICTG